MIISHVVAATMDGGVIGNHGQIPWRCPPDMRHFKNITQGGTILMGRKTHESIGRVLPGRENIVVSRSGRYAGSIEDGMNIARLGGCRELFIIGGGEIYEQTMDMVDRIYMTHILKDYEGDTHYKYNMSEFTELFSQVDFEGTLHRRVLLKRKPKK